MGTDSGIETLLDLDGQIIDQGGGYWVKIEAWRVRPTAEIPHGVRYSLTLHDTYGRRMLGYDNAHAVKGGKRTGYSGRIVAHDHRHRHRLDRGAPYAFSSSYQLLTDFFADVDRLLAEVKGG